MRNLKSIPIIFTLLIFSLGCLEADRSSDQPPSSVPSSPSKRALFAGSVDASVAWTHEEDFSEEGDMSSEKRAIHDYLDENAYEEVLVPSNPFENVYCPLEKRTMTRGDELARSKAEAKEKLIQEAAQRELDLPSPSPPSREHLERQERFLQIAADLQADLQFEEDLSLEERERIYGEAKAKFFEDELENN